MILAQRLVGDGPTAPASSPFLMAKLALNQVALWRFFELLTLGV